jgi:lipoyl(octanoyl) transferase
VWIERPGAPADKIAAIGIRVAEGVTMHGFALNCSNDLEPYRAIIPCGIRDAGVTTMSRELGRVVTPADVVPDVVRRFDDALAGSLVRTFAGPAAVPA